METIDQIKPSSASDTAEREPQNPITNRDPGNAGTTPPMPPANRGGDSGGSKPEPQIHQIQFIGSGGEYFRIWIMNIFLTIITLGLYWQWARVRRMKYFWSHTQVSSHTFEFTGVARKMFMGALLAGLAYFVVSIAAEFHLILGAIAIIALALIAPIFIRAAIRFRLSRSEWLGLPVGFSGTKKGAYLAMAIPVGLVILTSLPALFGASDAIGDGPDEETSTVVGAVIFAMSIITVLLVPFIHQQWVKYRHNNFEFAGISTRFEGRVRAFYMAYIKTVLVTIAVVITAGATAFGVAMLAVTLSGDNAISPMQALNDPTAAMTIVGAVTTGLIMLIVLSAWHAVAAYYVKSIHNLSWKKTRANGLAFAANLRYFPYLRLRIVNSVLRLLTLGFYTPFAQVAVARMKLESIRMRTKFDLDGLINEAVKKKESSTADAAAEFFDVDIGLG